VSTPPKVDAPGVAQRSGRPTAEEDHRGEHRPAWLMGEATGRRPPPPRRNQATSKQCRSRGRGRGATRCICRCREGQWWWCRCRNHHDRHCHGFRDYRAIGGGTVVALSGHRRPSKAVAQHTRGRHNSPGRQCNRGRLGR
jgi:hypothetical protein